MYWFSNQKELFAFLVARSKIPTRMPEKSSTAGIGGNDDGQHSKTKPPKNKKRVDPSDDDVAPTVRKRKKKEDLYKNFLEEKSERESGRRLMRMGNKKQRGEVRREEEVNEGKSDEKDSDLGKESQQIEMARMEKESREREVDWKEGRRKGENGKRNGKKRNWKEKRRKRGNGKRNGVEKKWKKERQEEVERRETEKRE